MNLVQRRASAVVVGACAATVLVVGVLAPAVWIAGDASGGGLAGAALPGRIVLPQAAPALPAGSTQLGATPAGQVLNLDVVLAGQNPDGLDEAVAAVSTPGSPDYRHYLTALQYAAEYGPSPAEVTQVSAVLRSEGLTVSSPEPGSTLLPVSGTASVVSAALGTPLESVQAPGDAARAIVNTASPQIPDNVIGPTNFAALAVITGTTRASSSAAATGSDPGRVDSPPTSMIVAPSSNNRSPCATAFVASMYLPPSENESGVTLTTPMISVRRPNSRTRAPTYH